MSNKSPFTSIWARASDYEFVNNIMIMPKKNAKIERYDILKENENYKNNDPQSQLLIDLLKINDAKGEKEIRKFIYAFAKRWGLPCLFFENIEKIYLHPRFVVVETYGRKLPAKSKSIYNVINPSETFDVHNEYKVEVTSPEDKSMLGKNIKLYFSNLSTSLHLFDPTRIPLDSSEYILDKALLKKNIKHKVKNQNYVAQQIIYSYKKGKWSFKDSKFLELKNTELNVDPLQPVEKKYIKSDFNKPGYTKYIEKELSFKNNKFYLDDRNKKVINFQPFLNEQISIHSDGKHHELRNADDFIHHFPALWKNFGPDDEKYIRDIDEFFYPMPGTDYFYQNYAENIFDIISLANSYSSFLDLYQEKTKEIKDIEKDKYSQDYINRVNDLLLNFGHFNSDINIGLNNSFEDVKYEIRAKTMAGIITHILAIDNISEKYVRRCEACNDPFSGKKKDQKTCGNSKCISKLTSRRYDKRNPKSKKQKRKKS